MSKNLRAGLVGIGSIGRHHARILASLPGVDFVGVSDPAGDIHKFAQGRPVFNSVSQLVDVGIDYAIVAVPTIYHLEVGLELATAGIHAMVEKPISHDSVTSRALEKTFASAGLVSAVGHVERYNPALQEAQRRLEELGSLYQIATRRQGSFPTRIADVGVVLDLATHDIDLTSWLTGQKYTSVSARTASRTGHKKEDLVAIIGALKDGTITNHLVNWLSPLKERVTIITGENGLFVADTLNADLTFYANGTMFSDWDGIVQFRGISEGNIIRYAISKYEPLRLEHENFRDAVLGKSSDIVTMEQGIATVLMAEAVIESARINKTIEIQV
jgi:UDP-N-acetylglucosamine 3-dehydrogenase